MNSSEIIEQKLGEAQHRRNQVLSILNSAPDATRPSQPKSSFAVTSSSTMSCSNNNNSNSSLRLVFEGDDRSLTNIYRTSRLQAPPPLCDVSSLRVDDLVTSFLRYRRSLHHLCYHGQSTASSGSDGPRGVHKKNGVDYSGGGGGGGRDLAVHQLSEVGILQQRIDKIRYECFVMLEQLRDSAVNGVIAIDTTNVDTELMEAPKVASLKQSIKDEKEKLKQALCRLTISNFVPQ